MITQYRNMAEMESRWLIVGLGNPGAQYAETRHNIGFMAIQRLGEAAAISGKTENKFKAIVGTGKWEGVPLILAQPLTFMNLSGEAVAPLMQYYDVAPEHLLVVYDDVALPFGKIRIRPGGSAGGHNGMKSIIRHMGGNDQFPRLRIGIGNPAYDMKDYVLSRFQAEERELLPRILDTTVDAIGVICREGVETARNRFNGMDLVPEATETP